MSGRLPIKDAISAGGVIWRQDGAGRLEIVLCGRESDGLWVLPKGTPDPGESIEQTALREATEETGIHVQLGEKVGDIQYWFTAGGFRVHKQVHHWLMQPVGGDLADHDHEFDIVAWVPIDEALRRLTYENEKSVVRRARAMLPGPAK